MAPSPSARRKDLLHVSKLLESLKVWRQSMTDAWASDVAVDETPAAPAPVEAGARLQSGAIVGIFALLVFYFLYLASPILIPIIMALLLSMLLAPIPLRLAAMPNNAPTAAATAINEPNVRGT
jgi:hypothetical protein